MANGKTGLFNSLVQQQEQFCPNHEEESRGDHAIPEGGMLIDSSKTRSQTAPAFKFHTSLRPGTKLCGNSTLRLTESQLPVCARSA